MRREMEEIFKLYETGKSSRSSGNHSRLADAVSAHKYIHARKNIGKVILNVK